jgi:hypothetical protein
VPENLWIFSNNKAGYYDGSDWDTSTILKNGRYYFKLNEPNRAKVSPGDRAILREYGTGLWGVCEITGKWVDDPEAKSKHKIEAGWFPIAKPKRWDVTLPYELVKQELANQNHRLRIAKATETDLATVQFALRIYQRLGYGSTDGDFFVLEAGLEEAVKANLKQLRLRLADASVQQQCNLGLGIGRTDLICLDEHDNFVVLELKAVHSSDSVVGQILRYMGYVRENWADKSGKKVKGIILTPSYDEQLRLAAKEAGIQVLRVRMQ